MTLEEAVGVKARPVEILMIEDNPGDVRLTQEALKDGRLWNHLAVARDGIEAMDYLHRVGPFQKASCPDLNPTRSESAKERRAGSVGGYQVGREVEVYSRNHPDDIEGRGGHCQNLQSARQLLHHQAGRFSAVRVGSPFD